MMVTVEAETKTEFMYNFQNEKGHKWEAKLENNTLSFNKLVDGFCEIKLSPQAVEAELDGTFDGEYDFEESCSLRDCSFTRAESYWVLSVLLSASKIMKK